MTPGDAEPALGRQRLDGLQQQGQAGPAVRAVLHRHPPLRVRRPDRREPGAVLRPGRRGWSPRCTPTTPGRRWSSTRGGRSTGTSTTRSCLDPALDEVAGPFVQRLPDADYLPTWYAQRARRNARPASRRRPHKTAVHAGTPTLIAHADTLGRTFLTIAHNRFERNGTLVEERYSTRTHARHRRQPARGPRRQRPRRDALRLRPARHARSTRRAWRPASAGR